jgi:hypothetical protein
MTEHVLIKEDDGGERLILRRGCDLPRLCEMREEGADLGGTELCGVLLAMKKDLLFDPVDVRLFGAVAVVALPCEGAHLFQKLRHV